MKLLYIALTAVVIGIIVRISYDTLPEHLYLIDGMWM